MDNNSGLMKYYRYAKNNRVYYGRSSYVNHTYYVQWDDYDKYGKTYLHIMKKQENFIEITKAERMAFMVLES